MRDKENKIINANEARTHFGQVLDEVSKDHTFFIKRRGKIAAVILSPDEYLDLIEVLAEEASPEIRKQLEEGKKEVELGVTATEADILALLKKESA